MEVLHSQFVCSHEEGKKGKPFHSQACFLVIPGQLRKKIQDWGIEEQDREKQQNKKEKIVNFLFPIWFFYIPFVFYYKIGIFR